MSLLKLPIALWHDILFNWQGTLPAVVRTDRACCVSNVDNNLNTLIAEKALRFPDNASEIESTVLCELFSWMRSKNMFISHLRLVESVKPLPTVWKDLLSWSARALQSLTLEGDEAIRSDVLSWASCHLEELRKLDISVCGRPRTGDIEKLLQRTTQTLTVLLLDYGYDSIYDKLFDKTPFLRLQALSVAQQKTRHGRAFLRACPNLTALSISGDTALGDSLFAAIADTYPLLRRLEVIDVCDVSDADVLKIARACPLLEFLRLSDGRGPYMQRRMGFVDVVCVLPKLHTLVLDYVSESVLLDIVTKGHPSLRVLDVEGHFTYDGLRQITAGLPLLTGLTVTQFGFTLEDGEHSIGMFEHCRNLELLRITSFAASENVVECALDCVAAHCPNLRILHIDFKLIHESCRGKIDALLRACPLLHTIHCFGLEFPLSRSVQVIGDYDPQLERWIQD